MEGKKGSTKAVQYLSYGDADILNAKEIKSGHAECFFVFSIDVYKSCPF